MTAPGSVRRREFLTTAGGVTLAGAAGCSDTAGADSPDTVVEEFYEAAEANSNDPERFADSARELTHSESPLRAERVLEFVSWVWTTVSEPPQR